jgi:hypothetical protein
MAGFNGIGIFVRAYNWVQDKANAIPITASRMDTEFDGIATGLSNCITRDGQTPAGAIIVAPVITGSATVPTQSQGDNSTKPASTAYVDTAIAAIAPRTGEESWRFSEAVYENGWLLENGQTIGSASSGATNLGTTFQALFDMLWANGTDTTCPMLTSAGAASTRGASAAADWGANKRLTLPNMTHGYATVMASGDLGESTVGSTTIASGTVMALYGANNAKATNVLAAGQFRGLYIHV